SRGWINSLRIAPDASGRLLLIASSFDKAAHVWDLESGEVVRSFTGHASPLYDAVLLPDARTIATVGESVMRDWELEPLRCFTRTPAPGTVFDAVFTPDGRSLLTSNADGDFTVRVFDLESSRPTRVLLGHENAVSGLALDAERGMVYSVSYDGTLRVWPLEGDPSSRILTRLDDPSLGLNTVAIAPDGLTIAVGGDDGYCRLFTPDGALIRAYSFGDGVRRVPSLSFSPDGGRLAVAGGPNEIVLLDPRTGEITRTPAHRQSIRVVRFDPTGKRLASAGDDRLVKLWSIQPGSAPRVVHTLRGHENDVFTLAFHPAGKVLASAGRSGVVKLWSVESGACLLTIRPHSDMVFTIAFSPDGRTLVSAGRDGSIVRTDLGYYDKHISGNEAFQRELRFTRVTNRR
ncbi:MAG: hypothetical protein K8E66_10705, partial [Phycisphaerales bacterium]|nr:hypothetical protein [Phycisphaerales bacterium]